MTDINTVNQPDHSHEYVLGTKDDELARLGLQHRLWAAYAHDAWLRAGVEPDTHCLDIGCGPGFGLFDMAQLVGVGGSVIGVDESPGFVEHVNEQAKARNLPQAQALQGDVHDLCELGIARGSIDVAFTRWLLCFVSDPGRVIAQAAELLKPGGRLIIQDYFNYETLTLAPKRASMDRVVQAVSQAWKVRGGNVNIMGDAPRLLADAGLELADIRVIQRLAHPGKPMWNWPTTFFTNFIPVLVEMKLLTQAEGDAFWKDWHEATNDPHSFLVLPPVFETIAVKRG